MFTRQTHRGSDSFFGQIVILSSDRTLNLNPNTVVYEKYHIFFLEFKYSLIITRVFLQVGLNATIPIRPNPFLTSLDHDIVDSTPFIFTLCDSGGMKISIATVLPFFAILASVSIL